MDELRSKRQRREAKEFLDRLLECPFVAVVMTPDGPVVYGKSADDEMREQASRLLVERAV